VDGLGIQSFALPSDHAQATVNALHINTDGQVLIGTDEGMFIFQNNVISSAQIS
jgi:hypothetical protein